MSTKSVPVSTPEDKAMEKASFKLSGIDMLSYDPLSLEENLTASKVYVRWGVDNKAPEYIFDTYANCATLQSILNGSIDFTAGNDIVNNTGLDEENAHGDTVEDVVTKLIADRWIFGGWALQVKFAELTGDIIDIAYIDFRKCRTSVDGKYIYVHDKWRNGLNTNAGTCKKFNAFNPATGKDDGVQIFYFKGPKTRGVYPMPDFYAALVSAETQIEIQKFHYNEIINNFAVSGIINFNSGRQTQEVQDIVEKKINDKFSGSENAAKLLCSFNANKDSATTFTRLQTDDFDDRYKNLSEETRSNIFISLRAIPILFGLPAPTGFAEQNYDEAFNMYNRTAVQPKQKEFRRAFKKIFGSEDAIQFIPFSLTDTPKTAEEAPAEEYKPNVMGEVL